MRIYDVVFDHGYGYKVTAPTASAAVCQVLRALGMVDRLTTAPRGLETSPARFVGTEEITLHRRHGRYVDCHVEVARITVRSPEHGMRVEAHANSALGRSGGPKYPVTGWRKPMGRVSLEGCGAADTDTTFETIHQRT